MDRLKGRIAFITGAGAGIAKASAKLFAEEGAKVVIAELKAELGRAAADEICSAGGHAIFVETDVTKEPSVANAVKKAVSHYGPIDILYNCAGGSIISNEMADDHVDVVDMRIWAHTMDLDLLGAFLVCRHGIPEIKKKGGGAVINMASWVAVRGCMPKHVYAAAKGAIISLTRSLAGAYAHDGIRVNAISPAVVRTERSRKRWENQEHNLAANPSPRDQFRINMAKQYPFSVAEPEDIAQVALFLASNESRMITGSTIMADGGRTAY